MNIEVQTMSYSQVYDYASNHLHVQESLTIIEEHLRLYNFDFKKFSIGFNGGKDCTVLLHLVYTVLARNKQLDHKLKTLYIRVPDTFLELEEFIELSVTRYNLDLLTFDGPNYQSALQSFKSSDSGQEVDAIFMGTRASDVSYPLNHAQRTDPGWPDFLRINPILNWSYHDVWSYLRNLKVPYCSLYDQGYTSIGARNNTHLNPRLKVETADGEVVYLPAYSLEDAGSERSGRSK